MRTGERTLCKTIRAGDASELPRGVRLLPLQLHRDRRGWLFEAFRETWADGSLAQVNVSWSHARTLRGSHVHGVHTDYFVLAAGSALVGLRDVRLRSPSFGAAAMVELSSETPAALVIPPGVLHGMYFPVDASLVTIESECYDPDEEIRCLWNDPELGIAWPCDAPVLSDDDARAQSFAGMMRELGPWQDKFAV